MFKPHTAWDGMHIDLYAFICDSLIRFHFFLFLLRKELPFERKNMKPNSLFFVHGWGSAETHINY